MVRLINPGNVDFLATCVYKAMRVQEYFTHIKEVNNNELKPCIYAMWHANQFLIHGVEDKANLNVLISNSADGEIIARAVEKWGFKVVRGSTARKGCIESTMQLIDRLKAGECAAIMVDGPRGPLKKVKNGVIKIAQKSGAPIVPVFWYCPQKSFVHLPSWDKMTTPVPIGHSNIINLYGEPIYVKPELSDDDISELKEQIRSSLLELEEKAPIVYKEMEKQNLWKKNK